MKRAAGAASASKRSPKQAKLSASSSTRKVVGKGGATSAAGTATSAADGITGPPAASRSVLFSELNRLFDPKPQDEDEDDAFMDRAKVVAPFEEGEELEDDRPFCARLRRTTLADDPKYAGKKITRAEMQPEDEDNSPESLDGFHDDADDDDNDSNHHSPPSMDKIRQADSGREENDGGDSKEDDSDDEEDASSSEAESSRPKQQRAAQQEPEDATQVFGGTEDAELEFQKAMHAKNQRFLQDQFLDLRIRMQKLLTAANQFPQVKMVGIFKKHSPELAAAFTESSQAISGLLGDLFSLQHSLCVHNADVPRPPEPPAVPFSLQDAWSHIEASSSSFKPFQNEVIEKWSRKAQLSSSLGSLSNMKALNQSIITQIETILSDQDRLLKRTQLKRSQYRIFGQSQKHVDKEQKEAGSQQRDQHLQDYDEEIFDDTDFYQVLIRSFLESSSDGLASSSTPEDWSRAFAAMRAQQSKSHRDGVDRKASKGRKIRFEVHEKLVNFMAPAPENESAVSSELLSSLFQ